MKSILIIVITLCLILGAGYYTLSEVSKTADILISRSDLIKANIENENWDRARGDLKEFIAFWNDVKSVWTILINHTEIDSIDMALAKIEQYIITQEKGLALGEMSLLKLLIEHIPEKEKLKLENIF
jgi:hypothetical protein